MKDLGKVKKIIRWRISQDTKAKTLMIDQEQYIRDLLHEEGMLLCNAAILSMKAGSYIEGKETSDNDQADLKTYQYLVGKLMYLACGTRPDISFVVGQLSRYNSDPRIIHMRTAKSVLRYLKGTMSLGLIYGRDAAHLMESYKPHGIVGYADSNYAGNPEDRKSIMGYCFFMNGAVVTWSSKKQRTVSTSTTEAEYIGLGHGAREGVWMRRFINELTPETPIRTLTLLGDNETSISLTKDVESQVRTKHIDVIHHHIRGLVEEEEICIKWIPGSSMLADGLTKALPIAGLRRHRELWGLMDRNELLGEKESRKKGRSLLSLHGG